MSVTVGSRSIVLITGASRGFGKSIALEAARTWGPALDMHLIARNKRGLEATKQAVEALVSVSEGPRIWTWPIDLGDLDALSPQLAQVFAAVRQPEGSPVSPPYTKAYLFNNAGLADFHQGGSLAVPGADKDAQRIQAFVEENLDRITNIYVTLDSHQ
eukprot:evm.model.NODE_6356_length_3053_cov_66.730759.1